MATKTRESEVQWTLSWSAAQVDRAASIFSAHERVEGGVE
jgi:hypothetical protein